MAKIYESVAELIGGTPLLKANNFIKANDLKANILVKLEYLNPAGSVKDRIAKAMIEEAEKAGKITKDTVIIELPAATRASAWPALPPPGVTGLSSPCRRP